MASFHFYAALLVSLSQSGKKIELETDDDNIAGHFLTSIAREKIQA